MRNIIWVGQTPLMNIYFFGGLTSPIGSVKRPRINFSNEWKRGARDHKDRAKKQEKENYNDAIWLRVQSQQLFVQRTRNWLQKTGTQLQSARKEDQSESSAKNKIETYPRICGRPATPDFQGGAEMHRLFLFEKTDALCLIKCGLDPCLSIRKISDKRTRDKQAPHPLKDRDVFKFFRIVTL